MKMCDFNLKTGYRGEIMCDEGFAKYRATATKNGTIEKRELCRFCLDRFVSEKTDNGFHVDVEKIGADSGTVKN